MIPAWNMAGVVPPVRPGMQGHDPDRSPYETTLIAFIDTFALSVERINILKSFFGYRAALHALGMVDGFQWLDGSFLENVENQEGRPPKDIDVVTYFEIPSGEDQASLIAKAGNTFDQLYVKSTYAVDAYLHPLGEPNNAAEIRQVSYWYSMWSHRRSGMWKGFVQVDLSPAQDAAALAHLSSKNIVSAVAPSAPIIAPLVSNAAGIANTQAFVGISQSVGVSP